MFKTEQILKERYVLQQQLGRTAVGHQTWLAQDLYSQEQVTVKLLAFSPQMEWEELKLFEREAQVLQTLNHPRIPNHRDYFDIDKEIGGGVPWFVMIQDYIRGFSLQELLDQGKRFSEKQVRSIATEVLEILIYLHQLSPPVLHRDIKPSNLILGEDQHIYLIDFGAVQAQAAVTGVTFTVVGTGGYAPLEQFWGRAVPASDLYAVGSTLIHLLTGISPADLPQKDSRIQFTNHVSLEADFISWIEKITEIALEKRFSTASNALKALESRVVNRPTTKKAFSKLKLTKPPKSSIQIDQFNEQLVVHFPTGLGINFTAKNFKIKGLKASTGLILGAVIIILSFPFIIPVLLLLFLIASAGLNSTHIEFNDKQFVIEHRILGFTYNRLSCFLNQILGVFLHSNTDVHNNKGNNCRVSIRAKNKTYFIGGYLTEEECLWLAQEIQDWLNFR